MCEDIHDGQEQNRSIQGPDTEAQDQTISQIIISSLQRTAGPYTSANCGLMRCNNWAWASAGTYSITSSAISRNSRETVSPSSFAVFRLRTISNVVGCSTGNSAGFAPLRILST